MPHHINNFNISSLKLDPTIKKTLIKFYFENDNLLMNGVTHEFLRACFEQNGFENEFLDVIVFEKEKGVSLKEFILIFQMVCKKVKVGQKNMS